MGVYGYGKNTTPFLDSLFKKGVVFNNAILPSILTFQTDAAIFSGLYPSQNNVRQWDTPINQKLDLMPKILGLYGYKTAAFVSPSLWEKFGWSKQFNYFKLNKNIKNVDDSKIYVADWMKQNTSPFFVFWHIYDVHSPYLDINKEFYSKNYSGPFLNSKGSAWLWEGQSTTQISYRINPILPPSIPAPNDVAMSSLITGESYTLNKEDIDFLLASYDSGIRHVDDQLSLFFKSIENQPWFSNTIFIISSEHGEDLKEHGFIFHRDLYDVNTRVPFAIIAPGITPSRIEEAVSSLDILPTTLELIDGTVPVNIEGKSLIPVISGESLNRDIYTERAPYEEFSIRSKNWKYILRDSEIHTKIYDSFMMRMVANDISKGDELYNLSVDSKEQKNLIGKGLSIEKELKEKVLKFKEKMLDARNFNSSIKDFNPIGGSFIPYP